MMYKTRKRLALLLVLTMLASFAPALVHADDELPESPGSYGGEPVQQDIPAGDEPAAPSGGEAAGDLPSGDSSIPTEGPSDPDDGSSGDTGNDAPGTPDDVSGQPGTPDDDSSGTGTPGGDEPGAPGGDEPDAPGGDEPDAPGDDESDTPGGDEPDTPGDDEPDTPGDDEPDEPSGDDEPDEPSGDDEPDEPSGEDEDQDTDDDELEPIAASEINFKTVTEDGLEIPTAAESALASLAADAAYWYYGGTGCDAVILPGGLFKGKAVEAGTWTAETCSGLMGSAELTVITVSGQQLINALEWGAVSTTLTEGGDNNPNLLQVSGLRYSVDTDSYSDLIDEAEWTEDYGIIRIQSVMVLDRESKRFSEIDPDAQYRLALPVDIANGGSGFTMFTGEITGGDSAAAILAAYVKSFAVPEGGTLPLIASDNSPLKEVGMPMDYEGGHSGRMRDSSHKCTPIESPDKPAADPTCTEPGYTGDIVCSECGDIISEGTVIPALGHDYVLFFDWSFNPAEQTAQCTAERSCTRCSHRETTECTTASEVTIPYDPADPETDGEISFTAEADFGGDIYTDVRTFAISSNPDVCGHMYGTELEGERIECVENGYSGDLVCITCRTILEPGTETEPAGHDYVVVFDPELSYDPAVKLTPACRAERSCTRCDCEPETVDCIITRTGMMGVTAKSDGYIQYKITAVFEDPYTEESISRKVILSKNPDRCSHLQGIRLIGAKPATCVSDGYSGDSICGTCEKLIIEGSVLPRLDSHEFEVINRKEPTCTAEGYSGDIYCLVDNIIVENGQKLQKVPHDFVESFEWSNDAKSCTLSLMCKYEAKVIYPSLPCIVTTKIIKAATRVTEGLKQVTAQARVLGKTYTDVQMATIPAYGTTPSGGSTIIPQVYVGGVLQNPVPETGDNSHIGLYVSLMLISLCGLSCSLFILRRKKT